MKVCVLEPENSCTNCGRCDDLCELDPTKICDNCFKCLESEGEAYLKIPIANVFTEEDYIPDVPFAANAARTHVQTLPGLYAERRLRC